LILFLFGSWGIYTIKYEHKTYYKDLDIALKEVATKSYLDQQITDAIQKDNIDDAVMYQHLAEYLGITLNQETLDEIAKNNDLLSKSWRNIKKFGNGFFSGEANDMAGLSGSIASDMTLYGDFRDLAKEGNKFVHDQPYDQIVFGMAAIGVGLSASQLFSFGATTPAKVGASIVKAAKKMGKLSKPFVRIITSKLSKAIDFKALKKVDYTSIGAIKKETKRIAKTLDTPYIRKAFNNIDSVHKNTDSYADTIALLKYVDDPKDLQKVVNVSKKYKKNTKAVFKVLGKGVIKGVVKGTARIIKWTSLLIAQMISFIMSFLIGIVTFFLKWFTLRKVKKKFRETKNIPKTSVQDTMSVVLLGQSKDIPNIVLPLNVQVRLGRGDKSDIKLNSKHISSLHLQLTYVGNDGVVVQDLDSANGTYIDGRKLLPNVPTVLKKREHLIVGSEDFVYSY
jgi:hypothetical protein